MKAILAVDQMGGIGYKGEMPWKFGDFPNDAIWFKNHTRNGVVIMGRKTKESLIQVNQFPLKGRNNIVITSKPTNSNEYILDHLQAMADGGNDTSNWTVIGGKQLIVGCIVRNLIDTFLLTTVPGFHEADVSWPNQRRDDFLAKHNFDLIDTQIVDKEKFQTYRRRPPK